jgi:UDP-N-acetyl-D-galactosamine dehydrogenase
VEEDFHVGFSPERINPGDKEHTLTTILKVVSGDDAATLERVAKPVRIGRHGRRAPRLQHQGGRSAKVIENTQRDLNIALMNELAIIFDKIGIDTLEVLKAAGTKWNFLPFRPGLVGGHCIGVDPYYLTHKAEMLGYHPQVILAGRRINDGMAKFVAEKTVKSMIAAGFHVKGSKVNVLGLTFKENCPDLRNSKVADIVHELESYGCEVHVHDPVAGPTKPCTNTASSWKLGRAAARRRLVAAVPHKEVLARSLLDFQAKLNEGGCFIDVKSQFDPKAPCAKPATASGACKAVMSDYAAGTPAASAFRPYARTIVKVSNVNKIQESNWLRQQLPLAGDRRGRLHRLEPGRSRCWKLEPARDRPRQLR